MAEEMQTPGGAYEVHKKISWNGSRVVWLLIGFVVGFGAATAFWIWAFPKLLAPKPESAVESIQSQTTTGNGNLGANVTGSDNVTTQIVNPKPDIRKDPDDIAEFSQLIAEGELLSRGAFSLCRQAPEDRDKKLQILKTRAAEWYSTVVSQLRSNVSEKAVIRFQTKRPADGLVIGDCSEAVSALKYDMDHFVRSLRSIVNDL